MKQKITTFLTFNNQAEEAMNFYISLFKDSKVLKVTRFGDNGKFLLGSIQLAGQQFMVLDGGSHFNFSEGFSLYIECEDQQEVDALWEKLSDGGEKQPCGWVKDKFGVSWQIIPKVLGELMQAKDPAQSQRVMEAVWKMHKIEIQKLIDAAAQRDL